MIFSDSSPCLNSWPMNCMLPSMRRRAWSSASAASFAARRASSAAFFGSTGFSGLDAASASDDVGSSPSSSSSLPPPPPVSSSPSCCSCPGPSFSRALTALSASMPFSNSSWHLFSSRRRKSMRFGAVSGLSKVGSNGWSVASLALAQWEHSCAYISQKLVSVNALSKIWLMSPSSVLRSTMPTSRMRTDSFSKLSIVSLLRMPLNCFCFFSSSGSSDTVCPIVNFWSVLWSAGMWPTAVPRGPPRAPPPPPAMASCARARGETGRVGCGTHSVRGCEGVGPTV
mmetsp:Transcript_41656/g.124535  ORF Transcript_41656/g.124535 Transcript_41656/m.124535 type:complete len:284 (+) Transcript_41656:1914-2765(+)